MNFEIDRQDFSRTRVLDQAAAELQPGQIRLAVERFALTTNNITYAVAGDMLDYWGFFPAEQPWGRLPVMGLASVAESNNPEIAVGGRYFGFFPIADQHVLEAITTAGGFRDVGAHRANHAAAYTDFIDVSSDPMFREDKVDEYLVLRGMFTTSFLADDQLGEHGFHGAEQTLVTSASSKTSIGLATCLARRGHRSVGLTSERNRAFVESLALYDQVITYDEIAQLDASVAAGMVDMAGNGTVRSEVHNHFGDNLRFSMLVGVTHRDDQGQAEADLPGATPEFFFAPAQIAKRNKEWGAAELTSRIGAGLNELLDGSDRWLTVQHRTGPEQVTEMYHDLLGGKADPSTGYVASMSPGPLH